MEVKLTLDGSSGIDIGVESDVPIDVDSSTLDIDASGAITISGSGVFDVFIRCIKYRFRYINLNSVQLLTNP